MATLTLHTVLSLMTIILNQANASEMIHHHGASLSKQQTADLLTCHGTTVGLPMKKSKVLRFQICCARTNYLSEL